MHRTPVCARLNFPKRPFDAERSVTYNLAWVRRAQRRRQWVEKVLGSKEASSRRTPNKCSGIREVFCYFFGLCSSLCCIKAARFTFCCFSHSLSIWFNLLRIGGPDNTNALLSGNIADVIWSAPTRRRFVSSAAEQSGDKSSHSKLGHQLSHENLPVSRAFGNNVSE